MSKDVIVCNGCCCGNTGKGHPEVPINFLTEEWNKYCLNEHVKLRISKCLGPCSMHNVSILRTEESQQWLGNLSQKEHYESIVEWARNVAKDKNNYDVPNLLLSHKFERFEEVVIRD